MKISVTFFLPLVFSFILATRAFSEGVSCEDLSSAECFARLTGCRTANSVNDFFKQKGVATGVTDWPEGWTSRIELPVPVNIPEAEFFIVTAPLGGGDHDSYPFVRYGDTYCDLTEPNARALFAPLRAKEDALAYYFFIKKDISHAFAQSQVYILQDSDYDSDDVRYNTASCADDYRTALKNKVTTVSEVPEGRVLDIVAFNYMYQVEFYTIRVLIATDGTITELSRNTLLDCGPGAVF